MTAIVPLFVSAGDDAGAPRKAGSDAQVMKKAWTAEVVGNLRRIDCGEEVAMILQFWVSPKITFPPWHIIHILSLHNLLLHSTLFGLTIGYEGKTSGWRGMFQTPSL